MNHRLLLLVLAALWLLAGCSRPAPQFLGKLERAEPWDPAFVQRMGETPIQDNGRVKPLMTFASFLLYQVHGRRDVKFQIGEQKYKLDPVEWLLDVWFHPAQADSYPLFRIENVGVLDALGIANDGQKLDFVFKSFDEIVAHAEKLEDLGGKYRAIDRKERDAVQEHIVQLYNRVLDYFLVRQQMRLISDPIAVDGDRFRAVFGGKSTVTLGELVANAAALRSFVREQDQELAGPDAGNARQVLGTVKGLSTRRGGPGLLPAVGDEPEWLRPTEAPVLAIVEELPAPQATMFVGLATAATASDPAARMAALDSYRDAAVAAATARGEFDRVPLEADYYRGNWHFHAMFTFIAGFLLAVVTWLLPRRNMLTRILWWTSMAFTVLALGMLCYDITLRCLITERPPIKNLYDTFLFIAALGVLTCVVVEFVMPRRVALALAPLAGACLIMLARLFEVSDGKDHMDPLMAVLDSNYWLATHVTTINIGYAAGLIAALLANAWIAMRVFRIAAPQEAVMKSLARAIYGVTCFSLLVSLFGTVWGGVWANESWGRFWGWDPKENGALMICVSQIALLHARWCGWVRDFGLVIWCCVTGMVVMFSWFHTNLLGVGLHSYGFSSGLRNGVWIGYSVELGFMLVGAIDVLLRPNPAPVGPLARPQADADPLIAGD